MTIRELSDVVCDREDVDRVIWDDTKPSYRLLHAQVSNQKIKVLGYQLIHTKTIV